MEINTTSVVPEELKKALHAGKIPKAYKDVISEKRVEEVRRKALDKEEAEVCSVYGTPEEMQKHVKEGYFMCNPESNLVYCPVGEIMQQKRIKKNRNIRYANKNVYKHCKNHNKYYKGRKE